MPRQRNPDAGDPKTRSRHGCSQCKQRKIKCGEQKPLCSNCEKTGQSCDYSIKLNWDGRAKRKGGFANHMTINNLHQPPQPVQAREDRQVEGKAKLLTQHTPSPSDNGKLERSNHRHGAETSFLNLVHNRQPLELRPDVGQSFGSVTNASPYLFTLPSGLDYSPPSSNKRSFGGFHHAYSPGDMLPPSQTSPRFPSSGTAYADNRSKRTRLSPSMKAPDQQARLLNHGQHNSANRAYMAVPETQRSTVSSPQTFTPPQRGLISPSPATSSAGSDESQRLTPKQTPHQHSDRRMSIESLISGSSYTGSNSEGAFSEIVSNATNSTSPKIIYGLDAGYPDFDVPHNQDRRALQGTVLAREIDWRASKGGCQPDHEACTTQPISFPQPFYSSPIEVKIPEELEPLPNILLDHPMNLLYFHHFINHTARVLVPHDCSGNPFRKILPRMALKDTNLLRLLLAYSATHRAKLMGYPEPGTRISKYVDGTFTSLYNALNDPRTQISNSTFATALVLTSLEIISPNPFKQEKAIPWKKHLNMARMIITDRGIRQNTVDRNDDETYFLTRWFAYLDVLGSLTSTHKEAPLFSGDFWADDPEKPEQVDRIDCFFGFTDRCVTILASLAALAKTCDDERAQHLEAHSSPDDDHEPQSTWQPSLHTAAAADRIREELKSSMRSPYHGCTHTHACSPSATETTHALELPTTNDAYHWAGLIYLSRRVLGRSSTDPQVQDYVNVILNGLGRIRLGGSAEACILFPLFIAGCEAQGERDRGLLLERLQSVEKTGLTQARGAKAVVERVWETGEGWEGFVEGEFVG